jgi:hypothetical protein
MKILPALKGAVGAYKKDIVRAYSYERTVESEMLIDE